MRTSSALAVASLAVLPVAARSGAADDGYRNPPAPIAQILDAEPTPSIGLSPDRSFLLVASLRGYPTIAELAAPWVGLAGSRINPKTNGPKWLDRVKGLTVRAVTGDVERPIEVPDGARIGGTSWSPDGRHIAFAATFEDRVALYVADVATGKSKELLKRLNSAAGGAYAWAGNDALVCRVVPDGRGPAPATPTVPTGPIVQESEGRAAPNRTYQDLLKCPFDETLYDHYLTCRIAVVSLDGTVKPIGEPGLHVSASPSPDARWLLVETIHRPYSYVVDDSRFPTRIAVWDMTGKVVRELADLPLQEEVPIAFGAVPKGMRSTSWRADAPAALLWVEALDGGDPANKMEKRDRVFGLDAPFTDQPKAWIDLEYRFAGASWLRPNLATITESWEETRRTRTWFVDPGKPGAPARKLWDRSSEDRYGYPGSFVTTVTPQGTNVVLTTPDGTSAYLVGPGASPEGDRPFLDRIDLADGKTKRLWQSQPPNYESCVAVLGPDAKRIVTLRESVQDPPNYFLRDVGSGESTQLTKLPDPAPQLAGIKPELITYARPDGVKLSAMLYLPPGYDKSKGPLPFFFWAYPQEFKTTAGASQVRGSPCRFSRPGGGSDHLYLLTQGYGILDGPTMPIVGEGDKEPNDTYIEQLVASAKAAVDKVVEMGVCDRERVGVGGHSYGSFMTANLLAHSDLFRAGVARSGAFNRTLTPFGFQREPRSFWKARDTYIRMSPFAFADKINEPLLLIHGMKDGNPGTFPEQSERMYSAIKGNGGRVRYVQLPCEDHGYSARESVGHMLWEMVTFLDKHVKGAPSR